jgi:hypothetical protein
LADRDQLIDLEPGVILQALLHVDSSTAFRIRRCCRALKKLLASDTVRLWQGTSNCLGSHSIKGGMWLHALVPEDTLSLYARLSSTVELANDLHLKSMSAVERLLEALCRRMSPEGVGDIEDNQDDIHQELISGSRGNSYPGKGQCFFGSWSFHAAEVRAMLCGEKPGAVSSSRVEFVVLESFFGGEFKFGVFLTLSRAVRDTFVLSWQVSVVTPGLLQEHLDCFEIHLHGHTTIPSVTPLGYEGSVSMMSSHHTHVPVLHTLSKTSIMKLLEHDCLICALTIRFYCMGNEARVTSAKAFDSRAQIGYRWTESGRKEQRRTKIGGYRWTDCGFETISINLSM